MRGKLLFVVPVVAAVLLVALSVVPRDDVGPAPVDPPPPRDPPPSLPAPAASAEPAVPFVRTKLHEVLGVTGPPVGDAACGGRGYRVPGVRPYCECFHGWEGPACDALSDPRRPLRGCVAYLMLGDVSFVQDLLETLPALDRYFNDRYHYPVVVFHTPNFAQPVRQAGLGNGTYLDCVRRSTRSQVIFEEVRVGLRPEIEREYGPAGPPTTCKWRKYTRDYYHMCRFFTYQFFRSPTLRRFDYVWRMDGNSRLARPVTCDPFAVLRATDAVFGFYRWERQEPEGCMGRLRPWAADYARARNFTPAHLDRIGATPDAPQLYLGAWGVFRWSFFSSAAWLDFTDAFDQRAFVYRHRTGEQALYAHGLAVFLPANALHQFGGFSPLVHRGQPIWPYSEWGTVRADPACAAWAARHPWPAPVPAPDPLAQWAERFPPPAATKALKAAAERERARVAQRGVCAAAA